MSNLRVFDRFLQHSSLDLDPFQLLPNPDFLRTLIPYRVPVSIGMRTGRSSNRFQHPFRGVRARGIRDGAVSGKVVDEDMRSLADFTKVHCLAPLAEEEKSIEVFKEDCGGLVDSAEDGLAVVCEFS